MEENCYVVSVKIKKILVPLDGSKNSLRALDMAIALARRCEAIIVGICIIYAPSRTEFGRGMAVEKGSYEKVKKFMDAAKTRAAQNGIVFDEKISYGNVGYNIVKFAHSKNNKIDMIVIASRGRGTVKEIFFGSVSHYVLHASDLPVLVVK